MLDRIEPARLSGRHASGSSDAREPWTLGRRPALDGLRAIAIIAVVGVHLCTVLIPSLAGQWFAGGSLGVNVFFVLSGFLITSLLLEEHRRSGAISLSSFWFRRSLRLFPALYLVLIAQFVYTIVVHDSTEYALKGDGLIIGYISNWAWLHRWPQPFGLGNTWSLGVEEQFYVVWPILMVVLLGKGRQWLVPLSAFAIGLWSFFFRWHLSDTSKDWVAPIADTRAELDAIMIGVLLACFLHAGLRVPRFIVHLLTLPSLALIVWQVQKFPHWIVVRNRVILIGHWQLLAVELATVVLILAGLEPRGIVYFVLALPPLRWLGRVSYSLYLWHVFVFSALYRSAYFHNAVERGMAGVGASLLLAAASYYWLERPFVAFAHRRSGRRAAVISTKRQSAVVPMLSLTKR